MQATDWQRAEQFPHPIARIDWRETHISLLILTGDWVYKIKKPMDFGFLDFSTLQQREHYCQEEVRLNRRTAPDLYDSVVPVHQDADGYNLCGRGELVDYAVRMRQFDPDALLQNRVDGLENPGLFFQTLGYDLAQFHETAAVCEADADFGSAQAVAAPVEDNFRQIRPLLRRRQDTTRLERVATWSQEQATQLADVFQQRKQQGRIKECHGDLHLANIALIDGKPVMFDCVEFNAAFRWIDVASDLAFLLMDLEINGYSRQANSLLNSYLEYSNDYGLLAVLQFYKVYRAMVRAKVALLRLQQANSNEQADLSREFGRYLKYANDAMESRSPYLAITCGVSGSGKSTLARELAARTGAVQLRSDVIRKQIAGLKPLQSSAELDPEDPEALYTNAYSEKTFTRLEQLAGQILQYGYPVIVDATFIKRRFRQPYRALAAKEGVDFYILYLSLPLDVLRERIAKRESAGQDASEAGIAIMERQLEQFEGFSGAERRCLREISGELKSGMMAELAKVVSGLDS